MSKPLRVLIIEDSEEDTLLILHYLRQGGYELQSQQVDNADALVAALDGQVWDVILSDYRIPNFDGMAALKLIRGRGLDVPFILVSGTIGEEIAVAAMKAGAQDYVSKNNLARLVPAMDRELRDSDVRRERLRAVEALRESEEKLRLFTEYAPAAIAMFDTHMCYVAASQRWLTDFGIPDQDLRGRSHYELFPEIPERWKEVHRRCLAGAVERAEEDFIKLADGTLRWCRWETRPWYVTSGAVGGIIICSEDITEHKRLTEQFLRAQRIESIGSLASGISHDLNNILAPIMMAADILDGSAETQTQRHLISMIVEAAQRGSEIVKQMLTFAQGVQGHKINLRPDLLVAKVKNILRETFPKSVTVNISTPVGLWPLHGDVTQLHQVLINLCVNARDSMMPNGGTLALTAENIEIDEHYAAMAADARPGHYVMLKVVDTGCGIPPSIIRKIFDPFFTTKDPGKGTGLGLSTVIGIVKSHGGFIEVASEVGKGSIFRVFIPAAARSPVESGTSTSPEVPKGDGETILLVDDEPEILTVAKLVLTQNGYTVLTAADGVEALSTFAQKPALIDLVVTDVMMPVMDGVNLTRALKRLDPGVRIIAASGHAEEAREEELQALGIHAYLRKPFNRHHLLEAVDKAIREGGS